MKEENSTQSAESTRELILEVALQLFGSGGYEATSLGEIADRLDITKAAIYYHFPAKEDILKGLVETYLSQLRKLLDAATPETAQSKARRKELLSSYLDLLLRHRRVVSLLAQDISARNHPEISSDLNDQGEHLLQLLAGSRGGIAARVRTAAALGALVRPIITMPDVDLDEFRPMLLDAAMVMMRTRLPRRRSSPTT